MKEYFELNFKYFNKIEIEMMGTLLDKCQSKSKQGAAKTAKSALVASLQKTRKKQNGRWIKAKEIFTTTALHKFNANYLIFIKNLAILGYQMKDMLGSYRYIDFLKETLKYFSILQPSKVWFFEA